MKAHFYVFMTLQRYNVHEAAWNVKTTLNIIAIILI